MNISKDGSGIDVTVNAKFNTFGSKADNDPKSKDLKDLAIEGIKAWGGDYNLFGQFVNINMNVNENASRATGQQIVTVMLDYEVRTDGTNGNNPSTISKYISPAGIEKMNMFGMGTTKKGTPVYYSERTFSNIVAHEFGHILGLADGYKNVQTGRPEASSKQNGGKVIEGTDIMISNGKDPDAAVSGIDVQMAIIAQITGERQEYKSYKNKQTGIQVTQSVGALVY
jgi:hypothetical protein